jgi:hypothetical protein
MAAHLVVDNLANGGYKNHVVSVAGIVSMIAGGLLVIISLVIVISISQEVYSQQVDMLLRFTLGILALIVLIHDLFAFMYECRKHYRLSELIYKGLKRH